MLLAMKTRNAIGAFNFDPSIVTAKQSFIVSHIVSFPAVLSSTSRLYGAGNC